jgi:hypothetical protein
VPGGEFLFVAFLEIAFVIRNSKKMNQLRLYHDILARRLRHPGRSAAIANEGGDP